MDILDDLLGLERMFCAEGCEEPIGPHGLHRIHFSEENLAKNEETCRRAAEEITKLRARFGASQEKIVAMLLFSRDSQRGKCCDNCHCVALADAISMLKP